MERFWVQCECDVGKNKLNTPWNNDTLTWIDYTSDFYVKLAPSLNNVKTKITNILSVII